MVGFPPGHPGPLGSVGGPQRHHLELVSNELHRGLGILFYSEDFHCI